jgi:hypothetical protein
MVLQMRNASYFGEVASRNLKAATASEVFAAANLGGARSMGRTERPTSRPVFISAHELISNYQRQDNANEE